MKNEAFLWAALGVLAYSLLRKQQAAQVATAANAAPLTINSDTDIIEEDNTGDALERLVAQLEAMAVDQANPRYTYFSADTPELTLTYRTRPYTRTVYDETRKAWVPFEP